VPFAVITSPQPMIIEVTAWLPPSLLRSASTLEMSADVAYG
jgi:hypothetical protein